jgi:site-specific recombinase XerD
MTPSFAPTVEQALDAFCAQSNLSPNTLQTYRHAVDHFIGFLETSLMARRTSMGGPQALERRWTRLGASPQDVNLLVWFVNYLGRDVKLARRRALPGETARLEPATVRLYGQAVISWFRFMADELILPESYPTSSAVRKASRLLRTYVPSSEARDGAPEPPEGLEDLIHAFDDLEIDSEVSPQEAKRQGLEGLRNRAIVYALADSGARVSEILRVTADEVHRARLNEQGVWHIHVRGKGRGRSGRLVTLRFTRPTLDAMRDYLAARNDPGATALFVSHAKTRPRHRGAPLSANAVWRILRRSARDLGLSAIHPHDFRHWRATQMLQEGVPIDQVQRFLNHRSLRTTQLYAKTAERHVDEAGARTSPVARSEAG